MKGFWSFAGFVVAFQLAAQTAHTDSYLLGMRIQEGIRKGDLSPLEQVFDADALANRALSPLKLPEGPTDYLRRLMQPRATAKGVAEVFAGDGKNYSFVGVHRVFEEYSLIFRCVDQKASDALTYHAYVLGEVGQGRVTLVDVYSFTPAEMLSETIRRQCLVMLAKTVTNVMEVLDEKSRDFLAAQLELERLASVAQSGDNAAAVESYGKLPVSLRGEKLVLFNRTRAALHASEAEFLAAIRPWRETYPNDPALEMFVSNYYWEKNDNAKALKSFERLNELLGGDPKLDLRMARLNLELEQPREAKIRLWEAVRRDPPDAAAFIALLQSTLEERKYDETAQVLSLQEAAFNVDLKSKVKAEPSYEGFRQSPAYQAWLTQAQATNAKDVRAPANPNALTLQGVMFSRARSSALISGKTVFVGDTVRGYKVLKIEPESVTLRSAAGEVKVLSAKGS